MDRWIEETGSIKRHATSSSSHEDSSVKKEQELYLLDLAAGSGEATVCLQEWHDIRSGKVTISRQTMPSSNTGITSPATAHPPSVQSSALPNPLAALHASPGPLNFQSRPAFIPPSRRAAATPTVKTSNSGGLPGLQKSAGQIPELRITATDPFTVPAYEERTLSTCLPLSFQDVAEGKLPLPMEDSQRKYDLAICSFALHLVGDHSDMFSLLDELSRQAKWLVVLAPHKKPEIKEGWGWIRWDISTWQDGRSKLYSGEDHVDDEDATDEQPHGGSTGQIYRNGGLEIVIDRVRCRLYKSTAAAA
ncbi:hypothetical protein QFC22_000106 [Naganishia vaughanmartiniae]|uniref:Uncharacterized protein n=1 Tax=Naganishia vaughanmartiniae TaxID=1424756 RepID=A0ACC2XME4_9TREE|nr:hypothetical protein QFC22_000106 [Naganishia vaughanmartiniae]